MKKRVSTSAQGLIEARIAQLEKNAPKPAPLTERDPNRPLWLPDGFDYEQVPLEVRQTAAELIQPAYEEMVQGASTGMEKSLGTSIVHLLWLEVLDQYDIKKDYVNSVLMLGMPSGCKDALNQYIRLIDAKLRIGNFLLRLRELSLRERKFEQSTLHAPCAEQSTPHTPCAEQSTPHTPCAEQSTPHTPCAAKPLQPGSPLSPPAPLSCKNEELLTKNEPTDSLPADPTWKNEQLPPKKQMQERGPQDPSPKAQDQSCKNENVLTKNEPTNSQPFVPAWKNEQLPSKNQTPELAPQDPSPKTQGQSCKNENLPTKNEPEEFEDLEGQQMYARYLALFPEAANAPIIPDPRKKQGIKPSPYYSPK